MSLIMRLVELVTMLFGISIFWSEKIKIEYNIYVFIIFLLASVFVLLVNNGVLKFDSVKSKFEIWIVNIPVGITLVNCIYNIYVLIK